MQKNSCDLIPSNSIPYHYTTVAYLVDETCVTSLSCCSNEVMTYKYVNDLLTTHHFCFFELNYIL